MESRRKDKYLNSVESNGFKLLCYDLSMNLLIFILPSPKREKKRLKLKLSFSYPTRILTFTTPEPQFHLFSNWQRFGVGLLSFEQCNWHSDSKQWLFIPGQIRLHINHQKPHAFHLILKRKSKKSFSSSSSTRPVFSENRGEGQKVWWITKKGWRHSLR